MPIIASLSFGTEREFQLKYIISKEKVSVILEPVSLLIMGRETQCFWQHCWLEELEPFHRRINLTFRRVCN